MILSFIGGFVLGIRRKGSPLVCLFRLTRLNSHEEGRDKQDAGKHSSQYSPQSSQRKYGEKPRRMSLTGSNICSFSILLPPCNSGAGVYEVLPSPED